MEDQNKQTEPTAQPEKTVDQQQAADTKTSGARSAAGQQRKRPGGGPRPKEQEASEFVEKVIKISRVAKVTKGGKKMSFSALVVVGDAHGRVGYCLGKANEVANAIKKGLATAKKDMVTVPLNGTTIPHAIDGVCGGALVMLKPASEGTGVIASGPVRAVCDAAGIHNILTKCHRSNNPINVVKATMDGLTRLKSFKNKAQQSEQKEEHAAA